MSTSMMTIFKAASSLVKMKKSIIGKRTTKKLLRRLKSRDLSDTNHEVKESEESYPETSEHENGYISIIAFEADTKFVRDLECREITVESLSLPEPGYGIDGTTLPEFPPIQSLQGLIGKCSCPFEKQLTTTDLEQNQARISLRNEPVEDKLKPLLRKGENLKDGIEVTVYDRKGRKFPMTFKFWSEKMHVLMKGWKEFCKENNELKECQDWVSVWMFRDKRNEGLCFAVIPRRFPIYKLIKNKNGNCSSEERKKKKKRRYNPASM